MLNVFLVILSSLFLTTIEIGVIAFVITAATIGIAVLVKLIKNKKLQKNRS